MKIRVTKKFDFEMGHALHGYDGLCKNIHGHSYKLFVTIIGSPIEDTANTKQGMVIDFGDLKKIINEEIVSKFDHALILNETQKDEIVKISGSALFDRYYLLPFQPTSENMVIYFSKLIANRLPNRIQLFSLRLYETESSFAEWYASDNE